MPYHLSIETNNDILWVKATGTRSRETVLSIAKDILPVCAKEGIRKTLIDVRTLEGRLEPLDAYEIAAKHFLKMRDRSVITQSALVDLGEYQERYKFFENVAVNRGYNLRIFSDPQPALQWLRDACSSWPR